MNTQLQCELARRWPRQASSDQNGNASSTLAVCRPASIRSPLELQFPKENDHYQTQRPQVRPQAGGRRVVSPANAKDFLAPDKP